MNEANDGSRASTSAASGRAREHVPETLAELMAHALAMENEAAERYAELADAMETHNNREVADLFRRMARIESRHADDIKAQMGWSEAPVRAPDAAWEGFEGPETLEHEDVHYLMRPFHALSLALAAEERAERFFARLAELADAGEVREAARRLQQEEREHVALVTEWLAKLPAPDAQWAEDPDPPRYTD